MAEAKKMVAFLRKKQSVLNMMSALEAFRDSYEESDAAEVPVRLELVNKCYEDYLAVMGKIEELEGDGKGDALEELMKEQSQFQTRYCKVKGFLLGQSRSEHTENTTLNSTMGGQLGKMHLRLPKIDLPSFDGTMTAWLTFRDRFNCMIHASEDIPTVMKLQYLLASLKGEAALQFEHTEMTADNYAITWSALLKKYDNKRLLVREYYRTLHFLPAMQKGCVEELVQLVDDFTRHVKGLERLGEPVEKWDTPLSNMLFLKLDDDSLLAWETYSSMRDSDTYADLVECLQERIKILKSRIRQQQPDSQPGGPSKVAGGANKRSAPGCGVRLMRGGLAATSIETNLKKCPACGGAHDIYRCETFGRMSVVERRKFVAVNRLCYNCLQSNHMLRFCSSKMSCRYCNNSQNTHHSMLCFSQERTNNKGGLAATVCEQIGPNLRSPQKGCASAAPKAGEGIVFLSTAVVQVMGRDGAHFPVRALIDSGSQVNFLSERLVQQLRLPRASVDAPITGVGNTNVGKAKSRVTARVVSMQSNFECCLECLVLTRLTSQLPAKTIDIRSWRIPKHVRLADPQFNVAGEVDMIMGADVFFQLILNERVTLGRQFPMLVNTRLGWIVSGTHYQEKPGGALVCASAVNEMKLESLMEKFFEVEDITEDKCWSVEEQKCEDLFKATTIRDATGKYIVRLPIRNSTQLGESRQTALSRFASLERRFAREPDTKRAYAAFIQEYIELGHMKEVDESEQCNSNPYYVPHHPVFKADSTTTKCRVVFDASCKTSNGRSLNDILMVGPTIQQDSTAILLRWRTQQIAVAADVEKMYRQVWVHEKDRHLQRILWRFDEGKSVKTYELNTVTYGTASAPFLAVRALQQVVLDHGDEYPTAASRAKDFYVDDLISGAQTVEEARRLCMEAKELYKRGGFELRKWASNDPSVLPCAKEVRARVVKLHASREKETMGTLGLVWHPAKDTLMLKSEIGDPTNSPITKRNILRTIAKIYDPLGIVDTVKAKAKQFMQALWRLKGDNGRSYDWDDEIPGTMQADWIKFASQLTRLQDIKVPRHVMVSDPISVQLHGFCDASELGYGACAYIRSKDSAGNIESRLLVSKSKVTPLSTKHTIARLELCAAHLLSKLVQKINNALEQTVPTYCWTDSTTVIHWLGSTPSRWKTFVANRVSQIQNAIRDVQWRHVPGNQNPADAVSRGRFPSEVLDDRLWWNGPEWLERSEKEWPVMKLTSTSPEDICDEAKLVAMVTGSEAKDMMSELIERYSSFQKVIRIVAWCLRVRGKGTRNKVKSAILTLDELRQAKLTVVRAIQLEVFSEEIARLRQGLAVKRSSPLKGLSPFLDEDMVMRVGGRLENAVLARNAKHPLIIPGKHRLATLIAEQYHKILLHPGTQLALSTIRQKFWVLNGPSVVKRTMRECVRCARSRPTMMQQPMAELPMQRVRQVRPFAITGVDYAGPIYLKGPHRRAAATKGYVSVFVWFVTKAVYLELVSELTTFAFLAALRRFTSRRGWATELHSDNGTNFRGASNHLNELYKLLQSQSHQDETSAWCAERGIKWSFTPPAAPHFGGLWEAAVKSMKHHLTRVLAGNQLTFEDMCTLLAEIEACLNSRPITPISDDPTDLEALTPGHFLIGGNLHTVPDVKLTDLPVNQLNHWRRVQNYTQQIWLRWHREYLQLLQRRAKWHNAPLEVKQGQLVILQEDHTPVCRWPLARVQEVHPGKDNVVRVVTLWLGNGKTCRRPVTKLAILPIE